MAWWHKERTACCDALFTLHIIKSNALYNSTKGNWVNVPPVSFQLLSNGKQYFALLSTFALFFFYYKIFGARLYLFRRVVAASPLPSQVERKKILNYYLKKKDFSQSARQACIKAEHIMCGSATWKMKTTYEDHRSKATRCRQRRR